MKSLPKGLVSVSEKVSEELDSIGSDAVDIGDIVQLWKAYSTNPSAHEGDAGYRLQNFFWRIWSSKRLRSSLTGSTLSRLFLHISEPMSTPTPTPTPTNRSTALTLTSFRPPAKAEAKESEPLSSSLERDEKHPENQLQHQQHPPSHGKSQSHSALGTSSSGVKPLQPILKKSNSSSHGEVQKTTRLLLTGLGGQSVTRKPSNPPTPIPPSRPILFGEQQAPGATSRTGQKKTFAVASKAKAKTPKRRPVLMRRKSSQQSSFSVSSARNHSPQTDVVDSPPIESDTGKTYVAAVQESEIDEEAVEDSPDEIITAPIASTTTSYPAPSTFMTTTTSTTADKSTSIFSMPPPCPPLPSKEQTSDTDDIPKPNLPSPFIQDLKALMHKNTPLPPLRPRASPPTVGFFSATACRHFDVRHLSEENYEQPNASELVAPDFRTRFAEQKRIADEYYAQFYRRDAEGGQEQNENQGQGQVTLGFFGQHASPNPAEEAEGAISPGARTGTTTEETETVSPSKSRFGDSHSHTQSHDASTVATSILTGGSGSAGPHVYHGTQDTGSAMGMFTAGNVTDPAPIHGHDPDQEFGIERGLGHEHQHGFVNTSANATTSAMAVPMSVPGAGNSFPTPPGLSLPRGRGGLSLLIEQSRQSMASQGMERLGTATSTEKERSEE
ncbi:hypothetical protein BDW75DRAFT_47034 [Aspergillus navahoensis]